MSVRSEVVQWYTVLRILYKVGKKSFHNVSERVRCKDRKTESHCISTSLLKNKGGESLSRKIASGESNSKSGSDNIIKARPILDFIGNKKLMHSLFCLISFDFLFYFVLLNRIKSVLTPTYVNPVGVLVQLYFLVRAGHSCL